MKSKFLVSVFLVLSLCLPAFGGEGTALGTSVYTMRPADSHAVYFTPENFGIRNDGTGDVSDALQKAVNDLKKRDNFGILFMPEGKYRISKTIYIPNSIRIIGYGSRRPEIILTKDSPGFDEPTPSDKGQARYMLWFTGAVVEDENEVRDAGAGTFYSALSNVDLRIENGNPCAVALRTHYAQHCFISHCDIHIGKGKAGVFDVGNEMEDVRFFGGDYGIYTTKTSPSWQFTMLNTHFEGQRKAAVFTQEGGWVIRRMSVRNVPAAVEICQDRHDKIYMEGCMFENVRDAAVIVSAEGLSPNQLCIRNTACRNVPVAVRFRESGKKTEAPSRAYMIKEFSCGLHIPDMASLPGHASVCVLEEMRQPAEMPRNDIPAVPDMSRWVNVAELGAVGDGVTDNTDVFRKAVAEHEVIYVPQGDYVISGTISLRENTVLIGLNPISTQLVLLESTPAFSGFGAPVPMLETPCGGKNTVSGIGINAGGYNYRAVGIKWRSGEDSYLNDVKFLGVHGTMKRPSKSASSARITRIPAGVSTPDAPVAYPGKDKAWDNQHWSLWVTDGGGGTFKDLWSADTYAASGILVTDTSTPARMYEISVEHHVRNEVTFRNVSNWEIYALQLEEEFRESADVQQIEMQNCRDMLFANLYLFRVIWVDTPLPYAIRFWEGCSDIEFYNVHNFTQMRFTADVTAYDINKGLSVFPWEFARLTVTGREKAASAPVLLNGAKKLASGFEYIEGMTADSRGNVYFSEQRMRRIYKWDASSEQVSLVCDLPWQVLSLGCDTEDNLLVCVKYYPQPGNSSEPPARELPDRSGTTFSWWGNNGFEPRFYSIDPLRPEETMRPLDRVPSSSLGTVGRVFLPAHRWRDLHDFDDILLYVPEYSYVAPDSKTVIPEYYDLLRSSSLVAAEPGAPVYTADEYNHRTVRAVTDGLGRQGELSHFANVGEAGIATDRSGRVYIIDGYIYVFAPDGSLLDTLELPERPSSVVFGGRDGDRLFVAARTSLYEYILR